MSFEKLHIYLQELYGECCPGETLGANDDFKTLLKAVKKSFDDAINFIHDQAGFTISMLKEKPVSALITSINTVLQKAVAKGIAYKVPDAMLAALQKNTFQFSGMKTYAEMQEASSMLLDEKGAIKSLSKFVDDVKVIHTEYNENYLKAERNFAVGSAQAASKWQKFDAEKGRYDLKYLTDNGPNVRETHRALENTVLPVDDPFWNEYAPKNGWNCHCFLVQVRKGEYPVSDSDDAIKQGEKATTQIGKDGKNKAEIFRFNAGKEMKIFPPGHPYFNAAGSKKAMNELDKISKEK